MSLLDLRIADDNFQSNPEGALSMLLEGSQQELHVTLLGPPDRAPPWNAFEQSGWIRTRNRQSLEQSHSDYHSGLRSRCRHCPFSGWGSNSHMPDGETRM